MNTDGLTFELTQQHLALLQRMNVGWQDCEFGAPEIDPKRPYGNSGVLEDIAEILGETPRGPATWGDEREFSAEQEERFNRLHRETQTALQVVLASRSFAPGVYRTSMRYKMDWTLAHKVEAPR